MPRGLGVGNADTVQQRARFFGYKASYAGLCRAWLDPRVATAFEAYVAHEESVRAQLAKVTRSGSSLRDWTRAFFLDRDLKPTRTAVIRLAVERSTFGDDRWFKQRHLLAPGSDLNLRNLDVVQRFVGTLALRPDDGHPDRTDAQRHQVAFVPASLLYEELVAPYVMYEGDLLEYTAVQLLVAEHRDRLPDSPCAVYVMSPGRSRERSTGKGERVELHQGSNSKGGEIVYPGDKEIRGPDTLSVQIFNIDVTDGDDGSSLESNVPALAIWVPRNLAADILVAR
jgi:Z1 domain